MNECVIIIFGASGDLSKRKLLPALYKGLAQKKIDNIVVVGASRDSATSQAILEDARVHMGPIDEKVFTYLQERFYYHALDFTQPADYEQLTKFVLELEQKYGLPGNRIIYCASAATFYCSITQFAAQSGLAHKKTKRDELWNRLVYEKPFGHDGQSAHEINACIANYFDESQIYRIDHYLTKELVSNIALVRFTNCVLEPLWNNRYIDQVQIVVSEDLGVENRGGYYDAYGALRDVVQNHILELVALVGMESPAQLTGEQIRNERAKVLEHVVVVDAVLGQYEGYQQEAFVQPNSTTETFAIVELMIKNPRWAGVPFYVKTGKCLQKKETVIHIKFKQVDCLLAQHCPSDSNYLTLQIYPEASFSLVLNAKKPGLTQEVVPVNMEFCHSCLFGAITPEAYEIIFEEILRGEQSISVRFDEIEYAWKVIDALIALRLPVYTYKKGSAGPQEAEEFCKKHGMRWRS